MRRAGHPPIEQAAVRICRGPKVILNNGPLYARLHQGLCESIIESIVFREAILEIRVGRLRHGKRRIVVKPIRHPHQMMYPRRIHPAKLAVHLTDQVTLAALFKINATSL